MTSCDEGCGSGFVRPADHSSCMKILIGLLHVVLVAGSQQGPLAQHARPYLHDFVDPGGVAAKKDVTLDASTSKDLFAWCSDLTDHRSAPANKGLIVKAGAAGGGAAGFLLLVGVGYLIARRKRKVAAANGGDSRSVKTSQTSTPPSSRPSGDPAHVHVGGMQTTDPSAAALPTHDRVAERVQRARELAA